MLKAFFCIIWRDLQLYSRRRGEWVMPLLFFVMVISLFPMALGVEPHLLARLAPAIIWVAVVLALLMSLDNVFKSDYQQGALEQFVLSPYPLSLLILGKSIAHWIAIGLPLLLLAPLFSVLLNLPFAGVGVLWVTLLLGIPTLSLIGSIGAALTVGLQQGGLLLAILVLPFMVPIVIFAASGVAAAGNGAPFYSELLLLAALLLLTLALGPVAISFALRVSIE